MAKAAEGVLICRTDGNQDPMLVQLTREEDGGVIVPVSDTATVKMDVRTTVGGDISIAGTPRGDGSGTFLFAVDTLPAGASTLSFDVDASENGVLVTYARGKIVTAERIGT